MDPISFHPDETTIVAPEGSSHMELPALGVTWADGSNGFMSCWMPGAADVKKLTESNPLYLVVLGDRQPPVLMTTDRGSILGPNDPGFPEGAEFKTPAPKPAQMKVSIVPDPSGHSAVKVQFNQSLNWLLLSPDDAMQMATMLAEAAAKAKGPSGLVYPPGYKRRLS